MKQFNLDDSINNNIYFLPESWKEVKYAQYVDIVAVWNETELGNSQKAAKIVSILTHIPLETVNEAGFDAVNKLFTHLTFLNTLPEPESITNIPIGDSVYYPQQLTKFGELAAFDKMEAVFEDKPLEKIPHLLAILLRKSLPVAENKPQKSLVKRFFGKAQSVEETELVYESFPNDNDWLVKRATLFANQLNPIEVMSLAAFFLSKGQQSQQPIQSYLKKQQKLLKMKLLLEVVSELNTDGKPLFRICQMMLRNIGKFLIPISERY